MAISKFELTKNLNLVAMVLIRLDFPKDFYLRLLNLVKDNNIHHFKHTIKAFAKNCFVVSNLVIVKLIRLIGVK